MRRPTSRPSRIEPANFGLDRHRHVPVDEPKPKRGGPSRTKMTTGLAARGFVFAHDPAQEAGMIHVLTNPGTSLVADRPHEITFHAFEEDGSVTTFGHVPDFAVLRTDGTVQVLDFARRSVLSSPTWKRRAELLKEAYLEDHGILYGAVDEVTLRVEPLYSNLVVLYAHSKEESDREALVAVRSALMRLGLPTTIGHVRRSVRLPTGFEGTVWESQYDRVLPTISAMAVSGEIRLDHRDGLSDATWLLQAGEGRA